MGKAASRWTTMTPAIILLGVAGITSLSCNIAGAGTNLPPATPKFDGQAPGEPQKIFRKIAGVIKGIDSKGKTITIQLPEAAQTCLITPQTKFTRDGVPARLGDLVIGEAVDCTVVSIHGNPSNGGMRDELVSLDTKERSQKK